MLESVKGYIYQRRHGITTAVTFVGGFYLAKHYIQDRLEEVKVKLEQERAARDSLKRRFQQTQEDVSYTILALIPTLSEQILDQMNIEALTQELQNMSKARNSAKKQVQPNPSSLASSIVDLVHEQDTRSDVESAASHTSTSLDEINASSSMSHSGLQSWVESSGSHSPAPSIADSSAASSTSEVHLSESMISASNSIGETPSASDSVLSTSVASDSTDTRTKAELWNEVKMLTFTRTLTTLYSTTLLCLLTTLQLTLLARSKYVASVLQLEREERFRERLQSELSMSNILLGGDGGKRFERLMSGDISSILDESEGAGETDAISEESESKYLTLTWWLLHVGWKDVGERVRRGVEEVFYGVSLKTKLAAIDLHRLLSDVRRRVEHEVTFEGNERRINFLSSLLPPTPETIQLVLTQGGYNSSSTHQNPFALNSATSLTSSQLSHQFNNSPAMAVSNMHPTQAQTQGQPFLPPLPPPNVQAHLLDDPGFSALIAETRTILSSSDFSRVLEVCLDTATEVLFAGLEKNVFVPNEPAPGDDVLRIRLAGLLPGLARWSQLALNGLPNELVDKIVDVREVSCLSAIVFAKFEERFQ
ncbi:hypothetical protein BYT27DRAFT_7209030 [Phlegmacium glaucopus]|nr:hypothetical protein BYT27DRAFT_7209030 [Phlegmacium glaucopus]